MVTGEWKYYNNILGNEPFLDFSIYSGNFNKFWGEEGEFEKLKFEQ